MKGIRPQLDKFRDRRPPWSTNDGDPFGLFFIRFKPADTIPLKILAAPFDGQEEWEHVSVSLPNRCPTWAEMCFVKNLFWEDHECVVQFHPPRSEYVNLHPFCLHLWRHRDGFPTPPSHLVGPVLIDSTKGESQ
jgi:hypothetical protein